MTRSAKVAWVAGSLLMGVAAAELGARLLLGLGDPVLYVAHPSIEYMLRPNQDVRRLGKHMIVNAYGMRSPPFPRHKADPRELRVLVMGDSVVNGGNQTDQSRLATTLLATRLATQTSRPAIVGNVSAGSWGPPNLLAWTREYGLMQADCVVVVLSSHDAADVPTFEPLNDLDRPTRKPPSGLYEGVVRYLPRYLPAWISRSVPVEQVPIAVPPRPEALEATRQLFTDIRAAGAAASLVQHFTRTELKSEPVAGYTALAAVAEDLQVPHSDDRQLFSSTAAGASPYRDDIHPNERGQALLAESLYQSVQPCLATLK